MSDYQSIEYGVLNKVATVAFNRPTTMNALTREMREELQVAVKAAIADDEVRVIVLTGRGKSFGSGQDLSQQDDFAMGAVALIEDHMKPIIKLLHESPKPVVSAINGACAGVSAAIAMACDLTIMADNSYFFMAFSAVGLVADGGASWHLANALGYKRAYQVIAEAGRVSADESLSSGLANKVVAADSLMDEAQAWAESLSQKAPLPMQFSKESLRFAMQNSLLDTVSAEALQQHKCFISKDCAEAMSAFMEKRKPVFTGK